MLPDFPKVKKKHIQAIDRYLKELIRQDPLFSGIREEHHFEGNRMSYGTVDGEIKQENYKEVSSEAKIIREDVIRKGVEAYLEQIRSLAEEMKKQKAEAMFAKIKEVTDETGNVVDGREQPFSFELFAESIKKIWIEFDEDGKPIMPTMVVHPELGDKIKGLLPQWEKNLEYKKIMDDIIEKKRNEWNDRESNRKLVD